MCTFLLSKFSTHRKRFTRGYYNNPVTITISVQSPFKVVGFIRCATSVGIE